MVRGSLPSSKDGDTSRLMSLPPSRKMPCFAAQGHIPPDFSYSPIHPTKPWRAVVAQAIAPARCGRLEKRRLMTADQRDYGAAMFRHAPEECDDHCK